MDTCVGKVLFKAVVLVVIIEITLWFLENHIHKLKVSPKLCRYMGIGTKSL